MPPRASPGVPSATFPPTADPAWVLPSVDGTAPRPDAAPTAVAAPSSRGLDSDERDEPGACVACGAEGPTGAGRRAPGASAIPVSGSGSVFGRISAAASGLGAGAASMATGALGTGAGTGASAEGARGAWLAVMRRAEAVGACSRFADGEPVDD